jgi:2-dehydro-3-deoxyphosphooctonate aldolase (KDO 8-P synthase)
METHPNPNIAKSDAPNLVPLKHMPALLECLLELNAVTKRFDYLEESIQTW